jgi:hypothetical protein
MCAHEVAVGRISRQAGRQSSERIHIAQRENGASSSYFYQVRAATYMVAYNTRPATGHGLIYH